MPDGRVFHSDEPATEKLRGPKPTVLVLGTVRSPWPADRRWPRVDTAETGKIIDSRYGAASWWRHRREDRAWSLFVIEPRANVHRVRKKRVWSISGITSSNTDRFLKFFHCCNLQKICNKAVVKYPTTPQTRHYTTLWNIDVRKLACPERVAVLLKDKLARILTCCRQQLHFKMKPVYYHFFY